jgi:D-alanine-D-alanine ligase
MRIAVLYNDDGNLAHGAAEDRLAVEGVRACAEAVAAASQSFGCAAAALPAEREPAALLVALRESGCDLVFNLVESLGGEARLEAAVAWLLELAGLPYTGCPPLAMTLGLNKPLAKAVLAAAGVPLAAGVAVESGDEPLLAAPFPWIVKPSREDASHGINVASLVHDEAAARARARWVIDTYAQPALVEQFVGGREFNISVLGEGDGARSLSPAEIDFAGLPKGHPPLVTYEAKWDEESEVCRGTPSIAARDLGPGLERRLAEIAVRAYRALGLRDYGRVDMRLDGAGSPVVLEVNPNPDLSPDAGLARAAARSGIAYDRLIAGIVAAAAKRHGLALPG